MDNTNTIGVIDLEVYFPKQYVDQEELEVFDSVSKGKYTVGLGQARMAFLAASEDVISISLTVLQNLLDRLPLQIIKSIGYLAVGTETLLDKSKSLKTSLMQLFPHNTDIEGITHLNACYGGTDALFSACAWLQISQKGSICDGRLAIVICSDIAFYAKGPARPTGGCGAIAMLLGPNAPIVLDNIRNSFFKNTYDFCKPNPFVEYPTVDGSQTVECYLNALKNCYIGLKEKFLSKRNEDININNIDYFCFHSPFIKLVQKSFLLLLQTDILNGSFKPNEQINLESFGAENFMDKHIQDKLRRIGQPIWDKKVAPSLTLSSNCGNMYTAALYAGLASLISSGNNLQGKTVLMFSYGSGLASSMFLFKIKSDLSSLRNKLSLQKRLDSRIKIDPVEFDKIMAEREQNYGKLINEPKLEFEKLFDRTFYLEKIDQQWKRTYQRYSKDKFDNKSIPQNKQLPEFRMCQLAEQFSEKVSELKQEKSKSIMTQQAFPASGFYKQPFENKLNIICQHSKDLDRQVFESGGLSLTSADLMVENCIGKLSLPMGLGLNFQINGKDLLIPMVTEEPSVIAAASSAAKFVKDNGIPAGFIAWAMEPVMTGQLLVMDCQNNEAAKLKIQMQKDVIIAEANQVCQSLVKRGGGVVDCNARVLKKKLLEVLVVDIDINVCESMGANVVNTVCEAVAETVERISQGRVSTKILTNLCVKRRAGAEFCIPLSKMACKNFSGEEVAKRILETYQFAELDVFRAATNNKGIMNGIDAVAIALGQDWRAIEAAAHTYAFYKNQNTYSSLTEYQIVQKDGENFFVGKLELPIAVGSKGGVLGSNPIYANTFKLLGNPTAKQISEILVSVGLAQNFAAIKALALEGIQKGHMNLHAKNLAIQAGVPVNLVEEACNYMKQTKQIKAEAAKQFLVLHDKFNNMRKQFNKLDRESYEKLKLSTFFVEIKLRNQVIDLHLAFDCQSSNEQIHLSFEEHAHPISEYQQAIYKSLFGQKQYEWLNYIFSKLDSLRLIELTQAINDQIVFQQYKIKLVVILLNLLFSNLVGQAPEKSVIVLQEMKNEINNNQFYDVKNVLQNEKITLKFGFSLFCELLRILQFNLNESCQNKVIKSLIMKEMWTVLDSFLMCHKEWVSNQQKTIENYLQFRQKKLCFTVMMYCDYLHLKEDQIVPETYQIIQDFGDFYELQGIVVHDIVRLGDQKEFNSFIYWENIVNRQNQSENQSLEKFKLHSLQLIKAKQVNLSKYQQHQIHNCNEKTLKTICDYYLKNQDSVRQQFYENYAKL